MCLNNFPPLVIGVACDILEDRFAYQLIENRLDSIFKSLWADSESCLLIQGSISHAPHTSYH